MLPSNPLRGRARRQCAETCTNIRLRMRRRARRIMRRDLDRGSHGAEIWVAGKVTWYDFISIIVALLHVNAETPRAGDGLGVAVAGLCGGEGHRCFAKGGQW